MLTSFIDTLVALCLVSGQYIGSHPQPFAERHLARHAETSFKTIYFHAAISLINKLHKVQGRVTLPCYLRVDLSI